MISTLSQCLIGSFLLERDITLWSQQSGERKCSTLRAVCALCGMEYTTLVLGSLPAGFRIVSRRCSSFPCGMSYLREGGIFRSLVRVRASVLGGASKENDNTHSSWYLGRKDEKEVKQKRTELQSERVWRSRCRAAA